MRATLLRTLSLLLGGAACGFVVNAARPGGVAIASWTAPTQCDHGGEAAALNVPREMAPAEAATLCGRPDVVLADARPAAKFAEGHVAGAVHLPCDAKGQVANDGLAHVDQAQTIVVYGDSTDEARPVALSLSRRHPDVRVAILAGGFPAWSSAGLACASGPCDECTQKAQKAQNP